MKVDQHPLVYFAFPKCASEWMRKELGLKKHLNRHLDYYNWNTCGINYGHCKPYRYLQHNNIDDTYTLLTLVRNPFDRLVSCWAYGQKRQRIYSDKSFAEFIDDIYTHRSSLNELPCSWMYMPFEQYFEGVIDKVIVFKTENITECISFLKDRFGIEVNNYAYNTSEHDHYSTYYTDDMRRKVEEVYAWEIQRFGYTFEEQ